MFEIFAQAQQHVLTSETLVPVGVCVACAVVVVGVILKVDRRMTRIENRLSDMDRRASEEWTLKDQQIFALRLQIKNPTIQVPDAAEIAKGNRSLVSKEE
jgi:hypothetical protein